VFIYTLDTEISLNVHQNISSSALLDCMINLSVNNTVDANDVILYIHLLFSQKLLGIFIENSASMLVIQFCK